MANAGIMSGLAAGLQYFAQSRDRDSDREKDFEIAKRKAELANQLEMDLMKQKQEYAKSNPKYAHFLKTAEGNIVGMDEQGNMKQLYNETPEGKQMILEKLKGDTAYKQAAAAAAQANATNAGLLGPARAGYYEAMGDKARRPPSSTRKATNEIDEAGFQKKVDEAMIRDYGKNDATTLTAEDAQLAQQVLSDPAATAARKKGAQAALAEYEGRMKARAQKEQQLRGLYQVVTSQQGLMAPQGMAPAEEEEDPYGDLLPDANNPAGE